MKNIVVLGGGTAGWLTSLFCRQVFPDQTITLVESDQIGILGAGEGSTPVMHYFLQFLDIDGAEMIAKTGGTYKMGISFENWRADGKRYMHDFGMDKDAPLWQQVPYLDDTDWYNYLRYLTANDIPLEERLLFHKSIYQDKVPFIQEGTSSKFTPVGSVAYHFDAHKLAAFFREKAEQRGVKRIEGKMKYVIKDGNGFINSIWLEDGTEVRSDFIFDCSGFARLLIGKSYETKWVDYSKHLPAKVALPFFPKQEEDKIIPYTRAIGMNAGWMWQIPLQERYGAGYVVDTDYISIDEAKHEIDQFMGYKVDVPREIKFSAGRYEEVWTKNCMAVGLSAGFAEPIEATSIWNALSQLFRLLDYLPYVYQPDERKTKLFNEEVANGQEDLLRVMYLHYVTTRTDTPFWREFVEKNPMPDGVAEAIEHAQWSMFNERQFKRLQKNSHAEFGYYSWIQIMIGLGLYNKQNMKQYVECYGVDAHLQENVTKHLLPQFVDHKQLLNTYNLKYLGK